MKILIVKIAGNTRRPSRQVFYDINFDHLSNSTEAGYQPGITLQVLGHRGEAQDQLKISSRSNDRITKMGRNMASFWN